MSVYQPKSCSLLVVEDVESLLLLLKEKFEHEGCRVHTARNGQDAVQVAMRHKPDLILSDILMPVMDGFEMVKKMRQQESLRDVPVIFLSVLSEQEYEQGKPDIDHVMFYLWKNDYSLQQVVERVKEVINKLSPAG